MIVGSPKAYAMAGMALTMLHGSSAWAQSNPFVPASAVSRANVEKIVDARIQALEERLNASASNDGLPSGAPGADLNGALVPGGMMPPGALPGAPGMQPMPGAVPGEDGIVEIVPIEEPKGPVDLAMKNGGRLVGCINGKHMLLHKSGRRLVFSKAELSEAVKEGVLSECR